MTASYSRTAGEKVGAYVISATLGPAGVLGNYDITYNTATFNITNEGGVGDTGAAGRSTARAIRR